MKFNEKIKCVFQKELEFSTRNPIVLLGGQEEMWFRANVHTRAGSWDGGLTEDKTARGAREEQLVRAVGGIHKR